MDRRRRTVWMVLAAAIATAACSGNLLGGRETCWPESEARAASLWRGILAVDASGWHLDTPDGESIPLIPGALALRADTGEILTEDFQVVARMGDDVTLFGGSGADGALVVCAVEERHPG